MGADLGHDYFQFRFDLNEDLHSVTLNRPYDFNNWMVVLERWKPIISQTFPSKISFWITLRGLPLHFWHEKMVSKVGRDMGELEDYEVTKTSARVRVLMDAHAPC